MTRDLPRDKQPLRLHALSMRWVLMLFVIFAAVMGGEARAVVVAGRSVVSERDGNAEMVERESEATRLGGRAGAQTERGDADGAGELAAWRGEPMAVLAILSEADTASGD